MNGEKYVIGNVIQLNMASSEIELIDLAINSIDNQFTSFWHPLIGQRNCQNGCKI